MPRRRGAKDSTMHTFAFITVVIAAALVACKPQAPQPQAAPEPPAISQPAR